MSFVWAVSAWRLLYHNQPLSMILFGVSLSIPRKTMIRNRSPNWMPWNCSSCTKSDHTWSSSRTRCVSILQLSTSWLEFRFAKLRLSSPSIGACTRTQSLRASTTTWLDSFFVCSSSSPCSRCPPIKNNCRCSHWLLTPARIWEFRYLISVFESTLKECSTTFICPWLHSLNEIWSSSLWNSSKPCSIPSAQIGTTNWFRSALTGRARCRQEGVITLLENECNKSVLRIWCDPNQLNVVVKNATQDVLDQAFYKVAHTYSVHLRVQKKMITDMGSKCPKDTTRWVAFGSILHWLLQKYRQFIIHNTVKRPVQAPSEI